MGDLGEWLHQYAWAAWGLAGAALTALEWFRRDRTLLMFASGAFGGALVALLFPSLLWLQVVVAPAVAISGLFLLRSTLRRRNPDATGQSPPIESLVGSHGRVTAQIGREGGEVRVHDQIWDARSFDPAVTVAEGRDIEVYGIDGITLIVRPVKPTQERESLQ